MRQATGEQFYISDAAYWAPYILPLTRGNCRANPISITGLAEGAVRGPAPPDHSQCPGELISPDLNGHSETGPSIANPATIHRLEHG